MYMGGIILFSWGEKKKEIPSSTRRKKEKKKGWVARRGCNAKTWGGGRKGLR